ncbi:hypothetical protein GCM10022393_09330 [Aquimarina addita]|uniref:Uncharacterized protein n=1 Tax=Aquimarina addita TaxID=870485 RepID=A0ABP7XCH1_9FLAO
MKTIELCLGMLFLLIAPISCDSDDVTIENEDPIAIAIENGEIVLDLQLEVYSLNTTVYNLEQRMEELQILLEEDPDNDNYLGELEGIEESLGPIEERISILEDRSGTFDFPPLPFPPVCDTGICPAPRFMNMKLLLVPEDTEDFTLSFQDVETGEDFYVFDNFSTSTIQNGFREATLDIDVSELPEIFRIVGYKIEEGMQYDIDFRATYQ